MTAQLRRYLRKGKTGLVEPKVGVDDRKFTSLPRTDPGLGKDCVLFEVRMHRFFRRTAPWVFSKFQALFSRYSTPAEHLNITPVFRFSLFQIQKSHLPPNGTEEKAR